MPKRISRTLPRRQSPQPGDDPNFHSVVDNPPNIVRVGGKKHGAGLIVLALIPVIAFGLGTWQVQRLSWKSELIALFEDRLVRDPLPLPPRVDPTAVEDFDYRRITATGHYRHDQEMLIGPRVKEGTDGYLVVTPLERDGEGTTVLVNRGWIAKKFKDPRSRDPSAMPTGEITVEGLLRKPIKKNMFTPDNRPETGEFHFPDVAQMAQLTGSQPIWIEETMQPDLIVAWDREAKGVPIGRAAEVNLRNNHAQYIFTW
jgi:surfeit locus 1 family protein